jgi:hypothetical protein
MPSSQTLYLITITNSLGGVAPSDGFIDDQQIDNYAVNLVSTPASLTYLLSQANRRGNLRYREIINQLSLVSNCYIVRDTIVKPSATYHTEATSFAFQIIVEHGDASLSTPNESVPGTFLTGVACLKRCVARALTVTLTRTVDVFDPTNSTPLSGFGTASVTRGGDTIASGFVIGPYAMNLAAAEAGSVIAVTKVVF